MVSAPSAFYILRPLCVQLARHPDNDSISAVSAAIETITNSDLQKLQEYLLFPLRLLLKQATHGLSDLHTAAISCVGRVLRNSTVYRVETFQDLFISLTLMLSSPANQGKVVAGCEELKFAVVNCLTMLLKRSDGSVMTPVYTASQLPLIGHAVSLLLHLSEHETMRALRVNAMICLKELALCDRKGIAPLTPSHIGGLFASFLPGIAISLSRVIVADVKQGQRVTTCALSVWTSFVTLVLGDIHLGLTGNDGGKQRRTADQISAKTCKTAVVQSNHADDTSHGRLLVKQTTEWQKETVANLSVLVTRIATAVTHPNWRVRLALVDWADGLLANCTRSLESSLSSLLEVLVTLLSDDYPAVSSRARDALSRGSKDIGDSPLRPTLESCLYRLSEQLPRLVRNSDDSKKLATLRLTSGYIRLLGSSINSMIHSYSHLQKLSLALLQSLQFDCSHILLLHDQTPCEPLATSTGNEHHRVRKSFRHIRDDAVLTEMTTICRLIGYHGDLHVLVDHFMDHCHQSALYRKQAILIITEILNGTMAKDFSMGDTGDRCYSDTSTIEQIISDLLDDFLSFSPDWTPVSPSSRSTDHSSLVSVAGGASWTSISDQSRDSICAMGVDRLNSDVLETCLILEAIASFAQILGERFRCHLMSALYPVLEKLGDANGCISHTAFMSLTQISTACQYDDVCHLISANSDYLLNDISLRLRHADKQVKAMSVLKVILMHGGKDAVCLVDDIIQDMLRALDMHYEEEASQFVHVLNTLVTAIIKWHLTPQPIDDAKPTSPADKAPSTADEMLAFFLDYRKQQNTAAGVFPEDEEEAEGDDGPVGSEGVGEEEEEKKEPPNHIKMVMQVMERCRHLLASSNCTLRMLVLDTVAQSCRALQHHEEQLLPLVHKVWPAFLNRFVSHDRRVTIKAFDVLLVMSSVCGDFIRHRVTKCIFPEIATFLQKESQISLRSSGPINRHHVNNKLQRNLLAGIGTLCKEMNVDCKDADTILKSSLPYLSARQPQYLQQACLESYAVFVALYPDLVWLRLHSVYSPGLPCRPHQTLADVKLTGSDTRNEFTDNITYLLQRIDDSALLSTKCR